MFVPQRRRLCTAHSMESLARAHRSTRLARKTYTAAFNRARLTCTVSTIQVRSSYSMHMQ